MNLLSKLSMALGLGAMAISASAVPAKRDLQTVVQPDGTTLQIRKVGDEHKHFTVTVDDILLIPDAAGVYCYADLQADGSLTSTGIKAIDPSLRSTLPAKCVTLTDPRLQKVQPRRVRQNASAGIGRGLCDTSFPSIGNPKVLCIMVQYKDVSFTMEDPASYFEEMLHKEGFSQYGATGCVKEYFDQNSKGKFVPEFDIYGPVTLSQRRSYYGGNDAWGNDKNPEQMVVESVKALDATVDFSQYDNDGDGYVDNVYIFYAGQGEASYGNAETVWPHSYDLHYGNLTFTVDGVTVDHYACSNEWEQNRPDGMGTFTHEFSHVMGLPDLYHTTDAYASYTPNSYSVLDYGPYNNNGCTPPAYSMYERYALGWMEPTEITGPMDCSLEHLLDSNRGYIVRTPKTQEFFLFENRQQKGWDKYIPGHGMLIWHVDVEQSKFDQNVVNNTASHQYVDIVEASGTTGSTASALAAYTWPGTKGASEFTYGSTPSFKTWSKQDLELPLTEIAEMNGMITFKVAGGGEALAVPEIHSPDMIEKSEHHFVASWDAVEGATDYEICVYAGSDKPQGVASCDMGSGKALTLTAGWQSSNTKVYTTTGNYGEASPSLRMDTEGDYLLSEDFDSDVISITFWRKGQQTSGSTLTIKGLIDEEWVVLDTEAVPANVADTRSIKNIPAGVRQVRFEYSKSAGNLAIDDIVIVTGEPDITLLENHSTAGETMHHFDQLLEGYNTYRFKVRARDEKSVTAYSPLVTVTLPVPVSIGSVDAADNAELHYYDMLGRRLLTPQKGQLLIRRQGIHASKVIY